MKRPSAPATNHADFLAFRAARDMCRREAREFYFASAFLPKAKRDAAHAAVAFCWMIRDAIVVSDDPGPAGAARMRHQPLSVESPPIEIGGPAQSPKGLCCTPNDIDQRLTLFRERLNALYDRRISLPIPESRSVEQHILHAFSLAVRRYEIPRHYFQDLAEGLRTDLSVARYATWSSLERHLRRSGGAASRIAGAVLGLTHSDATAFAIAAGSAIRLTQILCNLKADAAAGRIYLPLEDLASFRWPERDLARGTVNDACRRLLRFEVARARQLYRDAAEGLCWVAGDGARLAAATLLIWQRGVLDVIERRDYDVFSRRPSLSRGERLLLLPVAWRLARRTSAAPMPRSFQGAGEAVAG